MSKYHNGSAGGTRLITVDAALSMKRSVRSSSGGPRQRSACGGVRLYGLRGVNKDHQISPDGLHRSLGLLGGRFRYGLLGFSRRGCEAQWNWSFILRFTVNAHKARAAACTPNTHGSRARDDVIAHSEISTQKCSFSG